MTHEDILRGLVRDMEKSSNECADVGHIYLIDGRGMVALLRAIVDGAPRFVGNAEVAAERGRRLNAGAPYSAVSHHVEWTVKGGGQ